MPPDKHHLIRTAGTNETNMEQHNGSFLDCAVRNKTSRAAVHTTTSETTRISTRTQCDGKCGAWARSASVYCYVRSSGRPQAPLSSPLPGPASRSGQLADKSHPPRGRTFVIHRCGLLRGPRNIGLSGTLSILSWPCFSLRLDTSLFLSFLLLWMWLRHQLFICGGTHAQLQLCARAPPAGGDG